MFSSDLTISLRRQLASASNAPIFRDAQDRHPCLRQFESIFDAIHVLDTERGKGYPAKQRVVVALLHEQCRAPHALWTAALVWAFLPALTRIRRDIKGDAMTAADAGLAVLEAFIETAAEFDPDAPSDRTCAWLVQRTRDRLFDELRAEQRMQALVVAVGHDAELKRIASPELEWLFGERWKKPRGDDAAELAALLRRLVGRAIPPDRLDAVIATRLQGRHLRDYVDELHGGCDCRHRERRYQRAKREHSRTLGQIRRLLERLLVPDEGTEGLD